MMKVTEAELLGLIRKEWEQQILEMANLEARAESELEATGKVEEQTRVQYAKVIGRTDGLEYALSLLK